MIPKVENFTLTSGNVSRSFDVSRACNGSFNISFTGVGTNIVLRAEYSLDGGTTWTNCNAADTTITTASGQISIPIFATFNSLPRVRLNWVSSSGGTPAITPVLRYTT